MMNLMNRRGEKGVTMAHRTEGSAVIGIPDPLPVPLFDLGRSTFELAEAQALATLTN